MEQKQCEIKQEIQDDDETFGTTGSIKTTSVEKQDKVEQEKQLLHNCTYVSCIYFRQKLKVKKYYSKEFNDFISIFAVISVSKDLPASAYLIQRDIQEKMPKFFMDKSTWREKVIHKLFCLVPLSWPTSNQVCSRS